MAVLDLIRGLENQRYQAMLDGDVDTLESLLSDNLVYTHSFGDRDTKRTYLDRVRSGFFVYNTIEHPVEHLFVTTDCAVVVGQMRATVINNGESKSLNNACLAVWAQEGAAWRFLAYQPTPNP